MRIAVLATCFNRRAVTLAFLNSLRGSKLPDDCRLDIFLTDDCSSDGTARAVAESFPEVHLLEGSGQDFWAGGMRRAFAAAIPGAFDYYLWANDDTHLSSTGVARLLEVALAKERPDDNGCIVVGTVCDRSHNEVTYGGVIFPIWWRRTTPLIVFSEHFPIRCEAFNGNCVLISRKAVERVGNIDPSYVHGLGDYDYGLRATSMGVDCWVAPGFVGTCSWNKHQGTFLDHSLPLAQRWKLVVGKKAYPPKAWATYTHRHCGPFWFLYWAFPYFRALLPVNIKGQASSRRVE